MLCQTTDSGSNNNTMAETMHEKLQNLEGTIDLEWDYKTMHIKCFCHKIALVVNAGLKELGIEAPPPPTLKKTFLGNFPYSPTMERIEEENEEDEANEEQNSVVNLEAEDESDDDINSDAPDINEPDMAEEDEEAEGPKDNPAPTSSKKKGSATNRNKSNELKELTQAVSFFFFFYNYNVLIAFA